MKAPQVAVCSLYWESPSSWVGSLWGEHASIDISLRRWSFLTGCIGFRTGYKFQSKQLHLCHVWSVYYCWTFYIHGIENILHVTSPEIFGCCQLNMFSQSFIAELAVHYLKKKRLAIGKIRVLPLYFFNHTPFQYIQKPITLTHLQFILITSHYLR